MKRLSHFVKESESLCVVVEVGHEHLYQMLLQPEQLCVDSSE